MARRVQVAALALAAALAAAPRAGGADEPAFTTLADHRFDAEAAPTGPDTFRVFEAARGRVEVTEAFRWSGNRSVEIRDVAGDGDFPELQGYFPQRTEGTLWIHFALLFTDPDERFNVALAGPAGFRLAADGIAFWLTNRDGRLAHVSDGIPKKLGPIVPFTWYLVDVWYDVDAGRYDLAVREEGRSETLVALAGQPNAAARAGSSVDKFSFIGDTGEDLSQVVYYVDDVVLGTERPIDLAPFVAPGRRRLFFDTLPAAEPEVRFDATGRPTAAWSEWDGDRAARDGALAAAEASYRRALASGGDPARLLLKLADLRFLAGDLEGERALRERIFGSLDRRSGPPPDVDVDVGL